MALIDWPNPPALDEEYTHEGRTWRYNGTAWLAATTAGGNFMQVVNHGAVAGTARPVGAAAVYWIGTVEPTNALNDDLWIGGL